jgi:hypothetical protein
MRDFNCLSVAEVLVMEDVLKNALDWAIEHHKDSSLAHRCAFANSVQYLITGMSGGFGGPSLREHLVSWSLAGANGSVNAIEVGGEAMTAIAPDGSLPRSGQWTFEDAVKHCVPLCFEPAEKYRDRLLQIQEREYCFDDDPKDLEKLRGKP